MRIHKSQSSVVSAIAGLLQILLEVHGREMSDYLMNEPVWTSVWLVVLIGRQRSKDVVATLYQFLHSCCEQSSLSNPFDAMKHFIDEFQAWRTVTMAVLQRFYQERVIVIPVLTVMAKLLTATENSLSALFDNQSRRISEDVVCHLSARLSSLSGHPNYSRSAKFEHRCNRCTCNGSF
jgi:hypothetical protein